MKTLEKKPELKWVKITQLYVDKEYQRNAKSDRSVKNIGYIKDNFSWADCGALTVCYIPKTKQYAVVDGQHRLLAALARTDIPELPCIVVSDYDFKEQAKTFVAVNTKRVKLTNIAIFHASVAAGNEDAVSLKQILDECNVEVPTHLSMGKTKSHQTVAVNTLLKMLGLHSKKQICWALTIIPEAYGNAEGQMQSSLIKALAEYIKQNPQADRERMVSVLRDIDIDDLKKSARAYVGISGGTPIAAMVLTMERLYKNKGKNEKAPQVQNRNQENQK